MLFYLAVRMTFTLKTKPNRTVNTPKRVIVAEGEKILENERVKRTFG